MKQKSLKLKGFTLISKAFKGFTLIRTLLRKNLDKVQPFHGFTLIELLVVISIIGILMAVSFAGFSQSRKSARDTKRKADLEQIRSALEIYRNDCKNYPSSGTFAALQTELASATDTDCAGNSYMAQVPNDPLTGQTYAYSGSTNIYALCSYLETTSETVTGCASCGTKVCGYKVINP